MTKRGKLLFGVVGLVLCLAVALFAVASIFGGNRSSPEELFKSAVLLGQSEFQLSKFIEPKQGISPLHGESGLVLIKLDETENFYPIPIPAFMTYSVTYDGLCLLEISRPDLIVFHLATQEGGCIPQ